jgi:putative transcriptional regulator
MPSVITTLNGSFGNLIGVSRQTINAIEKEKFDPSLPTAFKMAELFQCAIEELFEFER